MHVVILEDGRNSAKVASEILVISLRELATSSRAFGHVKAFRKIGAKMPEHRSKAHQSDDIKADFGPIYSRAGMADFMARFFAMDETWLHHYDPITK